PRVIRKPGAVAPRHVHLPLIRSLEKAGDMQQGGLAGPGRPDQCNPLARTHRQRKPPEHFQPCTPLPVASRDVGEPERGGWRRTHGCHSYLSASTGSRRAARQDGYNVASSDNTSAIRATAPTSIGSISAGSWARK